MRNLKFVLIGVVALLVSCGGVSSSSVVYKVGDTGPGGGIVFYDAGSVQPWGRYLEASPIDFPGKMSWDKAVIAANGFSVGGLTDWRLPTKKELNYLYLSKEIVGGFSDVGYWSSSEEGSATVWIQVFQNGLQFNYPKELVFHIRPVRSF